MFKLVVLMAICTILVIQIEADPLIGLKALDDGNLEGITGVLDGVLDIGKRSIKVNTDPIVKVHKSEPRQESNEQRDAVVKHE